MTAMRYLAFLRGVNVGGRNRVPMADLRAALERRGFTGVRTVLQSGNVVLDATSRSAAAIEAAVHEAVRDSAGVTSDIFVRTAAAWQAALDANPFRAEAKTDPSRLHVLCLRRAPAPAALAALTAAIPGPDRIAAVGPHAYVFYPEGQGRSKLTPALLERHLGSVTARNWNTALKMAALAAV